MKEIEIKVQVEDVAGLQNFLTQEATVVKEDQQIDQYFSPKEKSFTAMEPVKEWLRLRSEKGNHSINYKNWHYNDSGQSNYCDEYETKVENRGELESILKALHFEPIITVDKKRKSYRYKNYEISLDEVVGLGSFVEIELKSDENADPEKVTEEMLAFLKQFNPGKIERNFKGYPKLLLDKDR